jgi:hypothetical protein
VIYDFGSDCAFAALAAKNRLRFSGTGATNGHYNLAIGYVF